MKPICVIKAGSTFPDLAARRDDFEDWVIAGLGLPPPHISVADAQADAPLPSPGAFSGICVTGSHSMVTDREPWSERLKDWLVEAVDQRIPLLGICYGHQLLADALGGTVDYRPAGREVGTVPITLTTDGRDDPLLGALPQIFPAYATHSQSVLALPAEATVLATSPGDPHHAFVCGDNAWGIQFHPEFDADVMRAYIAAQSDALASEGVDTANLLRQVVPCPQGPALLRRFAELASGWRERR